MKRLLAFIIAISLALPMQTVFAEQEKTKKDGAELSKAEKESALSSLYEADLSYIRQMIDEGFVTCEELTEYYLERIEEYNLEYNCFITICEDAVEKAVQRDKEMDSGEAKGALFGIPVVVQDNMDMAGYYTTGGYDREEWMIAENNAAAVEYLQREGAVIIGKTNMSTGGESDRITYSHAVGETKNAYNILLASGGFSGGAAAAVSLNFTTVALGTDAGSSLRMPAALNGCISLRSPQGLISAEGIDAVDDGEVVGVVTRTVYDQAVMMDAFLEGEQGFAEKLNAEAMENARIGVLSELAYPAGGTEETEGTLDREVVEAFENAVEEMENCGADVVTVSAQGRYEALERVLTEENLDAVVFPSYLSTPLKSGVDEEGRYWDAEEQPFINNSHRLSSAKGLAEITIPIGNHSLGAGIGLEMIAPRGDEQLLLDLAYSYTSKYDHRTAPTGAPDIYGTAKPFSLQENKELEGWMHIGKALLICGIFAGAAMVIAYRLIMKGVPKKAKKPKRRQAQRWKNDFRRGK